VQVLVQISVNFCGNALAILGFANASCQGGAAAFLDSFNTAPEPRNWQAVKGRRTPAGCPAPFVMAILVTAPPAVRYPPRTGTR
jgi:hypothetical protein